MPSHAGTQIANAGHHAPTLPRGAGRLGVLSIAPAILAAWVLSTALPSPAAAQSHDFSTPAVAAGLSGLDEANARAWVEPLTGALAPTLTAGFFTSGGRGDGFRVAVRLNAGLVSSGGERFDPVLPGTVSFEGDSYENPYVISSGSGRSPTVSGSGGGLLVSPRPGSDFEDALERAGVPLSARSLRLPDGLGTSRAPVPMVEVFLPLRGLGLQLVGRFSPTLEVSDEMGDVSTFGGGALLTVSRFLPVQVVEIGVSVASQKLRAADWLDASSSSLGVVVSGDLGVLRPYVHGTLLSSSLDVRYGVHNPEEVPFLPPDGRRVRFRHSVERSARAALGAVVALSLLEIAAEYQVGGPDVVSLRVSVLRP